MREENEVVDLHRLNLRKLGLGPWCGKLHRQSLPVLPYSEIGVADFEDVAVGGGGGEWEEAGGLVPVGAPKVHHARTAARASQRARDVVAADGARLPELLKVKASGEFGGEFPGIEGVDE